MNLCDIETIRAVLGRHGFHFSKSLGQNFLTDITVPERIAEMSGAREAGNVVEVGPGMGCLTAELCRRAEHVVSVELDRALLPVLAETMAEFDNFEVVQGDVLALDAAYRTVNRGEHIARRLLGANDQTDLAHRNFHCLLAAQLAEGKSRVRVLLEIAVELLYLAQRVRTQIVVNFHFSLDDGELHNIIS